VKFQIVVNQNASKNLIENNQCTKLNHFEIKREELFGGYIGGMRGRNLIPVLKIYEVPIHYIN